jgi:PKD domain-containing protein/galactose oxidase-like protein
MQTRNSSCFARYPGGGPHRLGFVLGALLALGVAALMVSPGYLSGTSGPAAGPLPNLPASTHSVRLPTVSPVATLRALPSPPAAGAAPRFGWNLLPTLTGPSARLGAASIYDSTDGYLLLVGGTDGSRYFNDTWQLRANVWTALPPAPTTFSGRAYSSIAYDPATRSVVLFGGLTSAGPVGSLWSFQGGVWSLLANVGPSARYSAAMSFNDNVGTLVLFGGSTGTSDLSDTWNFTNGSWGLSSSALSPAARENASFTYDPAYACGVLFGGKDRTIAFNDTWRYGRNGWTRMLLGGQAPAPMSGMSATYDDADALLLFVGGATFSGTVQNRTWALTNAGSWDSNFTPSGPGARTASSTAFDQSGARIVLFGGEGVGPANDTWTFSMAGPNRTWFRIDTATAPDQRTQGATAWDYADGYMVLFGGENHSAKNDATRYFSDTWTYRKGTWTELNLLVHPSARRGAMMAYDAYDGYVVLFGGTNVTAALNDTWVFQRGTWHSVVTPVAPVGRRSGGFTYDSADGYVVLFGGHNGTQANFSTYSFFNDTWTYRSGQWSHLLPVGHPGPRAEAQMAYFPPLGEVVLYAGYYNNTTGPGEATENDTWTFSAGVWTNLTSTLAIHPGTRDGGAFVFDEKRGDLMLFGGDYATPPLPDVWLFTRAGWVEDCATCALPGYATDHSIYDPLEGGVLAFGTGPHQVGPGPGQTWMNGTSPAAEVTVGPTTTDVGVPISGSAYAYGGTMPYRYRWNFDDGFTGTLRAVQHVLATPGPHVLDLNLTDSIGLQAALPIALTLVADPAATPTARVDPTNNLTMEFHANVSGGTPPFVITWKFGDGTNGTGVAVNHTYNAGSYTASVHVSDAFGVNTTGQFGPFIVPVVGLSVRLHTSEKTGWVPLRATLSAQASGGTPPLTYNWTSSGGTVNGSGPNATFSVGIVSNSTIHVTVTDRFRVTATANISLRAVPALSPTVRILSASGSCDSSGSPTMTVVLAASSAGGFGLVTYHWHLGVAPVTGPNATWTVPYVPSVNISLRATDATGSSTNVTQAVSVGPPTCHTNGGYLWFEVGAFALLALAVIAIILVWRKPSLGRRTKPGGGVPPATSP